MKTLTTLPDEALSALYNLHAQGGYGTVTLELTDDGRYRKVAELHYDEGLTEHDSLTRI